MITLNINKGLVEVEGWEQIESRPGFVRDLDPAQHTLSSVIGRYALKDEIRCGLSNCRQPHGRGYIVVTTDGCETNIGKDCGKRFFGVDFETLSKKLDRDILEQENRSRILGFSLQIEDVEQTWTDLRNAGGDWIYWNSRPLVALNKGCPPEVVHRVMDMVKMRTSVLTVQREATSEELDAIEVRDGRRPPRPHYLDVPVAEIVGLQLLYPENDFRSLVIVDVEEHLKRFRQLDIDALTFNDLRYWAQWIGGLDQKLQAAKELVAIGRRLLNPENLEPFVQIIKDKFDIQMYRRYLHGLRQQPIGHC